jgi:hypothetical protein
MRDLNPERQKLAINRTVISEMDLARIFIAVQGGLESHQEVSLGTRLEE